MEVVLVMFNTDGGKRTFPLIHDVTIIGRREDCDLRIPLTEVSRKHCRLIREGESLRVEDLGSSNGSYHNGNRVQESIIQAGDLLQVGPVLFTIQIDGVPPEDEIQPPNPRQDQVEESAAGADVVSETPATDATSDSATTASSSDHSPSGETATPSSDGEEGFVISVDEPAEQPDDQTIDLDDPPSEKPAK